MKIAVKARASQSFGLHILKLTTLWRPHHANIGHNFYIKLFNYKIFASVLIRHNVFIFGEGINNSNDYGFYYFFYEVLIFLYYSQPH